MFRIINGSFSKQFNYSAENKVNRSIRMCIYYIQKIFPKNIKVRINTKLAGAFNNKKTKYVGELSLSTTKDLYKKFSLRRSTFYDTIDWEFEGHMFSVPRKYDYVLTRHYEDYMTLPPVGEQKAHHDIVEISLDTTHVS